MCGAPARAQLFPRGRFAPYRGGAGGPWEEDAFISLHGGKKLVIWKAGRQRDMILQQPEKRTCLEARRTARRDHVQRGDQECLQARGLLLPGRHLGLDMAQELALFRGPEQRLQLACPGRGQAGEHAHQDGREHGAFAQAHDAAQHGKAEKA